MSTQQLRPIIEAAAVRAAEPPTTVNLAGWYGPRMWTATVLVAVLAILTASCSSGPSDQSGSETTSTTESPATEPTNASLPMPPGSTLFEMRYCELIAVSMDQDSGVTAEVWNTMLLNDCPQQSWDAVDLAAVTTDLGADVVIANGPRYWLLDVIRPGQNGTGTGEVRELGGIEMRSVATIDLGDQVADRAPYTEMSVLRDTVFVFSAGREIYELTGPDGSIYVMQSYSLQVDPDLTVADLGSLGDRLEVPDGWTYETRVLREDLDVLTIDGLATVVQDELQNTYQLHSRG